MEITIINIGDELLIGQVVNTNAAWMSALLNENGMRVTRVLTIADTAEAIVNGLQASLDDSDAVIITGGLGPTRDDVTKHVLASFFDSEFVLHQPSLENIEQIFARRGYTMSETNRMQALVPEVCVPLLNKWGTAPGMWFNYGAKVVVALPGVPSEMKMLMHEEVVPRLCNAFKLQAVLHKSVWTMGIGESFLSDRLTDWEAHLPACIKVAYLPANGMVRLRLTAVGEDADAMRKEVEQALTQLQAVIGEYIWGYDDDSLEGVVAQMLSSRGETLAVAESCTGGNIAHRLTSVAGASQFFKAGIVAYCNEVKQTLLGVRADTLEEWGAVSAQTAEQMAQGARQRLGVDWAVATTGVAGPTGGTELTPVGTVWIAIAGAEGVESQRFLFADGRAYAIERATNQALRWLQQQLSKN